LTSRPVDPKDPPPSLEEQYSVACVTSNLGLPHGPGAGAQGILAAAAWSEVHLGSALRRLRTQWDREKPTRKIPRPPEVLKAAGLTRDQARELHRRERITFNVAYQVEKRATQLRIHEFRQVFDHLTLKAAAWGVERPDVLALDVLGAWLDDPRRGHRRSRAHAPAPERLPQPRPPILAPEHGRAYKPLPGSLRQSMKRAIESANPSTAERPGQPLQDAGQTFDRDGVAKTGPQTRAFAFQGGATP
jgi:hypothetical protein